MYALSEIKKNIIESANKVLETEVLKPGNLTTPPNPEMGDLSLATFDLAKELSRKSGSRSAGKKDPKEIAETIKEALIKVPSFGKGGLGWISGVNVVGPYVNIELDAEFLAKSTLKEVKKQEEKYGQGKNLKGQKIMVEYAQPNPFKAFHIGHLRGTILGESICRLLEAQKARVIRTNYQGDVGMHIAKCLWAFQKTDPKDYPDSINEKVALISQCYSEGAQAFEKSEAIQKEIKEINQKIYSKEDEKVNELWELGKKWSLDKFHEIFDRLGTHFEREYMESEVMEDGAKEVQRALKKKILEENEGAVIFKGDKCDLDTRVFLNSQGLPTYEGKELGLAQMEFSDFGKLDLCIHNVAEEQISFFQVTFKVEELMDPKKFAGKQFHNAYGFVGLKSGKMSSRKGQVVLGQDIMDEAVEKVEKICKDRTCSAHMPEKVGLGAIKYGFLKINPKKYLAFDMDESVSFEGDSGPYLQYTYARIQSIFRKAGVKKLSFQGNLVSHLTEPTEHQLVLELAKFPEVLQKAAEKYDPSLAAKYLFDLAQLFNDYYHAVPILKAEEDIKLARLALIASVAQVLKNGLNILGIDTVDRM